MRDQAILAENSQSCADPTSTAPGTKPGEDSQQPAGVSLSSDESRSRRLMRSIARASRRYHFLERLSRRPTTTQDQQPVNDARNGNGYHFAVNGNSRPNGVNNGDPGHVQNGNSMHDQQLNGRSNGNGASQRNGALHGSYMNGGSRTPPLPEGIYQEIPPVPPPPPRAKLFQSSSSKAKHLQAQNNHQMQQLSSLR